MKELQKGSVEPFFHVLDLMHKITRSWMYP